MKKTINVNIGSIAFTMNDDAYYVLGRYLDDIRSRITGDNIDEIMEDIESRIADIFAEDVSGRSRIIDLQLARKAMERIGTPDDFGAPKGDRNFYYRNYDPYAQRKLYRSRNHKTIGGVCGGIAEYFNIDIALVRVICFMLIFFGGVSLFIYIILWIVIPLHPVDNYYCNDYGYRKRK